MNLEEIDVLEKKISDELNDLYDLKDVLYAVRKIVTYFAGGENAVRRF